MRIYNWIILYYLLKSIWCHAYAYFRKIVWLRQGYSLFPVLFNIFMGKTTQKTLKPQRQSGDNTGFIECGSLIISILFWETVKKNYDSSPIKLEKTAAGYKNTAWKSAPTKAKSLATASSSRPTTNMRINEQVQKKEWNACMRSTQTTDNISQWRRKIRLSLAYSVM